MTAQPDPVTQRLGTPQHEDPDATVQVVRSAERLQVGRAVRVSGRAVLRKYVVTETVTQTFQVRREEVRLDVEPLDGLDDVDPTAGSVADAQTAADAVPFSGRVVEVVLHREVPVVQLQVEATERVRLHVDTVTDQEVVATDVRHEELDVDAPGMYRLARPADRGWPVTYRGAAGQPHS